MQKPTLEQVEWVFKILCEHMEQGGSYRYLIYDRMGFPVGKAYSILYPYGMDLSNAFAELRDYREKYPDPNPLI